MKCPACGYERKSCEIAPEWECPSCKIAYNKFQQHKANLEKIPEKNNSNKNFVKENLFVIMLFTNLFLIAAWVFFMSSSTTNNQTPLGKSDKNTNTPREISRNEILNLNDIDVINKLSSYTSALENLAFKCVNHAKVYSKANEDCIKAQDLMKTIMPEALKLDEILENKNQDSINFKERQKIMDIFDSFDRALKDMETARLLVN